MLTHHRFRQALCLFPVLVLVLVATKTQDQAERPGVRTLAAVDAVTLSTVFGPDLAPPVHSVTTTTSTTPAPAVAADPPPTVPPTEPPPTVRQAPPTTEQVTEPVETQTPSEPAPSDGGDDVWYRLANCESGGNWSINTGNGYYGGLQMDMSFWHSYGGDEFASRPDLADSGSQIIVATRARDSGRGYHPWPGCARQLGLT